MRGHAGKGKWNRPASEVSGSVSMECVDNRCFPDLNEGGGTLLSSHRFVAFP